MADITIEIVGMPDIAERLHVKRSTVYMWQYRRILPPPNGYLSGRRNPYWTWAAIREWADVTGRLPAPEEET